MHHYRVVTVLEDNRAILHDVHTSLDSFPSAFFTEKYILIPEDTSIDAFFCGCFTYDSSRTHHIAIDSQKARECIYNIWRKAREPLLQNLDVEFQRALERNDQEKISSIISRKQCLRDITKIPLPEFAKDDDVNSYTKKIKSIWPDCLGIKPSWY